MEISDIWSLGLVIVELVFDISLWKDCKFSQIIRKVISYCNGGGSMLEKIAREHNCSEKYNNMDEELKKLLELCLSAATPLRPTADEITNNEIFCKFDEVIQFRSKQKTVVEMSPLERLDLCQVYYLWQLTGGDVQAELKKEGLIRSDNCLPILTIPRLVPLLHNGKAHPIHKSQSSLFDHRIVILNTNNLTDRLLLLPKRAFYPLLHCPQLPNNFDIEMQSLPLVIRERNIEYQFYRIVLFERLLKAYPFTKEMIKEQAKIDIPPLLRGRIWACLLNVLPDGRYEKIDKVTPNATDRQIEVDIPRCHQYDDFLSSPTGHLKLKRLLKAWVTAHPQYVYWQGLG
jgi:TBC domain-containing protein kinase-like protein